MTSLPLAGERRTWTLADLLQRAEELLIACNTELSNVAGIHKLRRKIDAERSYLTKLLRTLPPSTVQKCSNLTQLSGVVDYLRELDTQEVSSIETTRTYKTPASGAMKLSVQVDVVTQGGKEWRKFIARNPAALVRDWRGQGDFKRRTLLTQLDDYLTASKYHPKEYRTPTVYFHFICGVEKKMAEFMESRGIKVVGTKLDIDTNYESDEEEDNFLTSSDDETDDVTNDVINDDDVAINDVIIDDDLANRVNLDITAGIALITELCHGGCYFKFVEPILTEQAEWERAQPALPPLNDFLQDKTIYMCSTAFNGLKQIVDTMGGPNERQRWEQLSSRLKVVDDAISKRSQGLVCQGKVNKRSRVIFGTGDQLKAVTVTANSGFVRAARGQGVDFTVFLHQARVLTEMKQPTATPIPRDT